MLDGMYVERVEGMKDGKVGRGIDYGKYYEGGLKGGEKYSLIVEGLICGEGRLGVLGGWIG